jgi:hypothetical protein
MDTVEKRKISSSCWESNLNQPAVAVAVAVVVVVEVVVVIGFTSLFKTNRC